MTETDLALKLIFARLVPAQDERVEWDDVLFRAAQGVEAEPSDPPRPAGRRRLALAAIGAAVLLGLGLSPVGAAIADRIGDFSAWLSGDPGQPASPAEQQAFQEANSRSWAGFAPDAKLRRLIETESSGTSFTLYGFRSGQELCLRLVASGAVSGESTHCAPRQALQVAKAPALVVASDESFGTTDVAPSEEGYVPAAYSATFGIASDGVEQVDLRADDGEHQALVGGNAFLYLADHPKLGTRVRSAEAIAADGSRVALGLQAAPFGDFDLPPPPSGEPKGPTQVERRVSGGTIGWVERLERRGEPLPSELLETMTGPDNPLLRGARPLMARVIQPEPGDSLRVGLVAASTGEAMSPSEGRICVFSIDQGAMGGGCNRLGQLFAAGPIRPGLSSRGSGQFSVLSGVASDDVASLKLFFASGDVEEVALRDNAFLARVARSDFPFRLVAYDDEERVIGIDTQLSDGMTSRAPNKARETVHELARIHGDEGGTATLRAGTPAGGYRCWSIMISGAGGGGGCTPWPIDGTPLMFVNGEPSPSDVFLTGELPPDVAWLTVTYVSGEVVKLEPLEGFVLSAIPSRFLRTGEAFVALRAFDASGKQIAQKGLRVAKRRPSR